MNLGHGQVNLWSQKLQPIPTICEGQNFRRIEQVASHRKIDLRKSLVWAVTYQRNPEPITESQFQNVHVEVSKLIFIRTVIITYV